MPDPCADFERLTHAAQECGAADLALDPEQHSHLRIGLLQGLPLQLGVFGDKIDVDASARAASLLDGQPAGQR